MACCKKYIKKKFRVGDQVCIVAKNYGHSYAVGDSKVHTITYVNPTYDNSGGAYLLNGSDSCTVYGDEIRYSFKTRKEEADYLEANILTELEKTANDALTEIKIVISKIKKLREFSSDKEELVHLIAQCIKSGGNEKKIVDLLDGIEIKIT